jgi:hypothetical protein
MPHFCMQELMVIMMAIPALGYVLMRGKHYWHRLFHRKRPGKPITDGCCKHTPKHTDAE